MPNEEEIVDKMDLSQTAKEPPMNNRLSKALTPKRPMPGTHARLGEPPKTPAGSVRQYHVGRAR